MERKKILILDREDITYALEAFLEDTYYVVTAADGVEGVDKIKGAGRNPYELIICRVSTLRLHGPRFHDNIVEQGLLGESKFYFMSTGLHGLEAEVCGINPQVIRIPIEQGKLKKIINDIFEGTVTEGEPDSKGIIYL